VTKSGTDSDVLFDSISNVVGAIYQCALDPGHWHDALEGIAKLSNSHRCSIADHDYAKERNQPPFKWLRDAGDFSRLDQAECRAKDPCSGDLKSLPVGAVATRRMLIDDHEFQQSKFYQESWKPQGLGDAIFLKVHQTGLSMIACRLGSQRRYGANAVRLLSLLAPHICRTITISEVLNDQAVRLASLEATLNTLTSRVYLADRQGCIVFMNQAAEHEVSAGKILRIDNGRLAPIDRVARSEMSKAITRAVSDEAAASTSQISLGMFDGKTGSVFATIMALNRSEPSNVAGSLAAAVVIFVQDSVLVSPLAGEAFAKLYQLTSSELRVLLAMSPGLGVKEAAAVLGISETTAKTHVQHIYDKTFTSKQTELMHLFTSFGCQSCSHNLSRLARQ
jgi:DNA-binding CsgD family transcriptional regulator/PAS domain-containing protein